MENLVSSLFTLACQMQCCWSPESTLLLARASWTFCADTRVWVWDLDGPGEGRTSPGTGDIKTSESPQMILSRKWRHSFAGTRVGGHYFFPRSLSSAEVSIFCAAAVLNVALWDLQDEASGGFRKLCSTEKAQLCLRNPGQDSRNKWHERCVLHDVHGKANYM